MLFPTIQTGEPVIMKIKVRILLLLDFFFFFISREFSRTAPCSWSAALVLQKVVNSSRRDHGDKMFSYKKKRKEKKAFKRTIHLC